MQGHLYLLYVASDLSIMLHPWTELDAVIRLEQLAGQLRDQGINASCRTMHGDPAASIGMEAQETQADLIVMSTHGRSGPGRWLYGSVADQVLREATVPILLIPATCGPQWASDYPLRILVPLDGSAEAEAALGPARKLAEILGADVVLARVAEHEDGASTPWYSGSLAVRLVTDADLDEARHYLEDVAARPGSATRPSDLIVELGGTTNAIAGLARPECVDLIVMATPSQAGLAGLSAGSNVSTTLRQAQVPLLLLGSTTLAQTTSDASDRFDRVLTT